MTDNWIEATTLDAIPAGDVIGVNVAGKDIALYKVEGKVFATDNLCTHGKARMSDGFLEGHEIECPLHQGRFDIRSGQATLAPCSDAIRSYAAKIEDGRVWLRLVD